MQKRNAVIMAAGTSSRFVPLSAEVPKGLLEVRGEVLIERQIRQLKEADIDDITVVTGYKAEMFQYLKDKFGVQLVHNEDYYRYNNVSSIIRVLDRLDNTFICSSDNYFPENVFIPMSTQSYYSALYAEGHTGEYCLDIDENDCIRKVSVGGNYAWYMIGHVYFSSDFSRQFKQRLETDYQAPATKQKYWEDIYINHIEELPKMKVHRYKEHEIEEFDSLDELRKFDESYIADTRSSVVKHIVGRLGCREAALWGFQNIPHEGAHLLFSFDSEDGRYKYDGSMDSISRL